MSRVVWTGTHSGEFWGVAPTGKTSTVNTMFIHGVVDGRISWEGRVGVVDLLSWHQQLGLVPSTAPKLP